MTAWRRGLLLLALLSGLAACLPGGRGGDTPQPTATASPITGGEIAVTALDAPAAPAAAAETPALAPDAADPATPDATAEAAPPPPPKSPAQLACERRGGTYAAAGLSGARSCVQTTRDGGKQCSRQTQCEGMCLARSQTCAPVTPLFGCHEILQADGRRVTLCID